MPFLLIVFCRYRFHSWRHSGQAPRPSGPWHPLWDVQWWYHWPGGQWQHYQRQEGHPDGQNSWLVCYGDKEALRLHGWQSICRYVFVFDLDWDWSFLSLLQSRYDPTIFFSAFYTEDKIRRFLSCQQGFGWYCSIYCMFSRDPNFLTPIAWFFERESMLFLLRIENTTILS